ncbi:hypothetical protein ACVOZ6_004699 [Escherichia coli]
MGNIIAAAPYTYLLHKDFDYEENSPYPEDEPPEGWPCWLAPKKLFVVVGWEDGGSSWANAAGTLTPWVVPVGEFIEVCDGGDVACISVSPCSEFARPNRHYAYKSGLTAATPERLAPEQLSKYQLMMLNQQAADPKELIRFLSQHAKY